MKRLLLFYCTVCVLSCGPDLASSPAKTTSATKEPNLIRRASANPYQAIDVSPMDLAYFPTDYPIKKMQDSTSNPPLARVIYSRPHRQGRQLFGALVKWGQPWRLGANEASEIQFYKPVTIQGKQLPAGQYILYAIPYEDHWVIALNRNLYSWGLRFDPKKDVARFDVPAITKSPLVENFTMLFQPSATGADLVMAWENMEARLPIQF